MSVYDPVVVEPLPIEEQKMRDHEISGRGNGGGSALTWDRFTRICETLRETGQKSKSCEAHGVSYWSVRRVFDDKRRPIWRELWDTSLELFRDELEEECIRRARDGVSEPVFYKGEVVGHIQRYSDRLLEAQLRAERPEKYRDNVSVDAEVRGGVVVMPARMSVEDYLAQKLEAAQPKDITPDVDPPRLGGSHGERTDR